MNQQTHNTKSEQKDVMNKTYWEEVKYEAHTENVTVPGAVTNAVPTTASERGGGNVHKIPYQEDVEDKTYTTCLEPSPTLIPTAMVLKTAMAPPKNAWKE